MWKTCVQSLGWEDPLEKGMATHSSILAWRIPRTVYSLGSQRVGHNWATFTFTSGCQRSQSLLFIVRDSWGIELQWQFRQCCQGVQNTRDHVNKHLNIHQWHWLHWGQWEKLETSHLRALFTRYSDILISYHTLQLHECYQIWPAPSGY